MTSSRILTHSISSHLLPRRSFRTTFRLRAPTTRAATSVIARKTVLASTLHINPLGYPAAEPSRSIHPNFSPFSKPPFQCRRQFHNSQPLSFFDKPPSLLPWTIIAVCSSCFAYAKWAQIQLSQHGNDAPTKIIRRNFFDSLTNLREGRWWTLLTSSIMHTEAGHLLLNMFCLLVFGTDAVSSLGAGALVVTWVGAGVFGSAASLIHEKIREKKTAKSKANGVLSGDETKSHESIGSLGASGSIYGIFALLTCLLPRLPKVLVWAPVKFPAWWLLAGNAGFSVAAMHFGWLQGDGHDAHLGGMLFGVLYSVFLRSRFEGGLKSWMALKLFR